MDAVEPPQRHSVAYAPFRGPGDTLGLIGLLDFDRGRGRGPRPRP